MIEPTPEQIAESEAYWSSREGLADRLSQRAKRLHSLVKLKAPELVIEQARKLVFQSLMTFPVDESGRKASIEFDIERDIEQTAALQKAGYFDDAPGLA